MEYFAHYEKEREEKQLLREHLKSVASLIIDQIPPVVEFDKISNSIIKQAAYWMGYFHDLGKYSDFFQEYLIKNKNSRYKNHAHISACYSYSFLDNKLPNSLDDKALHKILIYLCYLSIRLHHCSLKTQNLFPDEDMESLWKELDVLSNHLVNKGKDIIDDMGLQDEISLEQYCSYLNMENLKKNKINFTHMHIQFKNRRVRDPKWFFLLIYLFSLLIDVDKLDAAYIKPKKVYSVSPVNVDNYLQLKHDLNYKSNDSDLIERRKRAKETMLEVVNSLSDEEIKRTRFFTLTAPTGIGKTLSSLQCVLRLQERISEIEGYIPRIITSIPFINIIEQNRREYENVFGENIKMVVHHRLSDFSTNTHSKEEVHEEVPIDKSLLEVESWEGDAVLTTFVQLFQSIFTGENRLLKKINKLAASIVILDEAQAVPEDYMPLIGAVLQMISKYYGTRFVLMTATQPKLLEFGSMLLDSCGIDYISDKEVVKLLPDCEKYFQKLKRTRFVPLLDIDKRLDTEEFINLFFGKWSSDKSALIVVNTIKRSIELYDKIKKELDERHCAVPIYYLSTNIIPLKRRKVIEEVKGKLDKGEPVILVSTQTIEAGVDLDFDMAFRDFAPIDSLIQTAGRVNREGKKGEYLPVYIVQLEADNHYVYNLSHLQSTLELLSEEEEIFEQEYGKLVEQYYNIALNRGVSDESRTIWEEGILKLDFNILQKFELIKELGEVYDVFVEKDLTATILADAYEEILKCKGEFTFDLSEILGKSFKYNYMNRKLTVFERKALLKLITAKMSDYIVQVRILRTKDNRPIEFKARGGVESKLYWIPKNQIKRYYDEETGFIDKNGEAFIV